MTEYTDAMLIEHHNTLLAEIERISEAQQQELKPYTDGINAIKTEMLSRLQARGAQNSKVEGVGTAYQVTNMSAKVDNAEQFLDFIAAQNRWDMLSPQVLKDPVRDWLDKNSGTPPPGIHVEFFTKCNIRRT